MGFVDAAETELPMPRGRLTMQATNYIRSIYHWGYILYVAHES